MTERLVRGLVIDDEPVARQALRDLLTEVPWVTWIGEAADGVEAIAAIRALQPELIFLDVQMPGATGIEVLEQTSTEAAVIFTTAHDDYAMIAFELGAIDYLRKPFGRDRFLRALERARPHLAARQTEPEIERPTLADRLSVATVAATPITRLFVRDRGQVVPLQVSDIVRCESDGDYVAVYGGGRRYLVYINLAELAGRLDQERFVRVHRSHLINLDRVAAMVAYDANRLEVRLHDGSRVVASRAGTQLLRARFT